MGGYFLLWVYDILVYEMPKNGYFNYEKYISFYYGDWGFTGESEMLYIF